MDITTGCGVARDRYYKSIAPSAVPFLLGCCALAFVAHPSMAAMPAPQDSTPVSASPAPPDVKASIYVYRERHMVGAIGHPLIFVNGNFLAVMKNANYAKAEVPQGTAVVFATVASQDTQSNRAYRSSYSSFPPTLQWPKCVGDPKKPSCTWDAAVQSPEPKEEHGCAKVDWRHLEEARPEDVKLCKTELFGTSAALNHWFDPNGQSRDLLLGMVIPGQFGVESMMAAAAIPSGDFSTWLQMCGPTSLPKPISPEADKIRSDARRGDNLDDWSRCKNAVDAATLILQVRKPLQIETEAGKSYYVKWSVTGGGGKMELVDEAKGAKEIHKLHPVKD